MTTLKLLIFAALLALTAACWRQLTFRIVDEETHAPLPNIRVERSRMGFDRILLFNIVDATTDDAGLVHFDVHPGDRFCINPPVHPMGMGAVSAYKPRWINGRRSAVTQEAWLNVTYTYADQPRIRTAARVDGAFEIQLPNDARNLRAQIAVLLQNRKRTQAESDKLLHAFHELDNVDRPHLSPDLQQACHQIGVALLHTVAESPTELSGEPDELPVLFRLSELSLRAGNADAAPFLHNIYDSAVSRLTPSAAERFKNGVNNLDQAAASYRLRYSDKTSQ